jgi:peptide chain release factor
VIKCQETRSRDQNRQIARRLLADKVEHVRNADESRVTIKAKEAAKKRASKLKKSKRKYRKLDEARHEEASTGESEPVNEPLTSSDTEKT